jgi:vancomycin resistance protein VanJ
MIQVRCPTGCGPPVPRPYARRTEPVRCANCTAWFAAASAAEDASVVDGVLRARPGESLPLVSQPPIVRRLLRATLIVLAIAYPVLVVAVWLGLAWIGEKWWPTTIGLYLPPMAFALPLPLLTLALAVWGPRWLLAGQAIAAAVVLFPLMGLKLGGGPAAASGQKLRVLSYNVDYGFIDKAGVRAEIEAVDADVVLLQASDHRILDELKGTFASYHVQRVDQFTVASRFAVTEAVAGDGFARFTLQTPLGVIDVFDMHPVSPRAGLQTMRGNGLRSGDALRAEGRDAVAENTARRREEVEAVAAAARAASHPVIIAGDTNLPHLSPLLREQLGGWQDGFGEVGRGFGYTFPANKWLPWMRIDRVMAGPELRFVRFEVGAGVGSDHHCVWAELVRR